MRPKQTPKLDNNTAKMIVVEAVDNELPPSLVFGVEVGRFVGVREGECVDGDDVGSIDGGVVVGF